MTTERTVFLAALEIEDPAARAAYLDEACAGKPALRQRIEQLLQSDREAETFLDVPALEQLASEERALTFLAPPRDPDALGRLEKFEFPVITTATTRSSFDSNLIEDKTAGNPGSYAATASATKGWTMHLVALRKAQ